MTKLKLFYACICLIVLPLSAHAALVKFTFDGGDMGIAGIGFSKEVSGVTIKTYDFKPSTSSFDLSFSKDVRLVALQTVVSRPAGFVMTSPPLLTFTQGPNTSTQSPNTSTQSGDPVVVSADFVNQFTALANEVLTVTATNVSEDTSLQILEIVVDDNVTAASIPEPTSLALLGIALAGLAFNRKQSA